MTLTMDDFARLQQQVEKLRSERDQLRGSVKTLTERLKAEYNCSSIEEAKQLLDKYKRKELRLYEKYAEAKAEFEKRWKSRLEGL